MRIDSFNSATNIERPKLFFVCSKPDHLVLGVLVDVHDGSVVDRLGGVRVLQR